MVQVTPLQSLRNLALFLNPNVLVAVIKGMRAVKLLHQNPPVLNWGCQLMQVVLYNGCKKVLVVVAVVVVVVVVFFSFLLSDW